MRLIDLTALASLLFVACRADTPRSRFPAPTVTTPIPAAAPGDPAAEDVRRLTSDDFRVRSRAAADLVEMGEPALEALGRAGSLDVVVHGRTTVSATRPVVAAILEHVSRERLSGVLTSSPHASVRSAAAEEAGRRAAWEAIPALIGRLEDQDPAVRRSSASALRRITNRVDLAGPTPADSGTVLAAEWRAWWQEEGRLLAPPPASRTAE